MRKWQIILMAPISAAVLALALAALLPACRTGPHPGLIPDPGDGALPSELKILVEDASFARVPGADVYFGGSLFKTGSDGIVLVGHVDQGTYEASVDHPDYLYFSETFAVPARDYTLPITLKKTSQSFAVARVLPRLGVASQAQNGRFVVEFNEPIDAESVDPTDFAFDPALGAFSITVEEKTCLLEFTEEWQRGISVRWKIRNTISSTSDESLAGDYFGIFQVSPLDLTPPSLLSTVPENGEEGVFRNQRIIFVFTDEIDPASLSTGSIEVVPDFVFIASVDGSKITIEPDAILAANTTYRVSISGLRDFSGNALASPATVEFTTGSELRLFKYRSPDWTRVGDKVCFESDVEGGFDIWQMNADGTGLSRLTDDPADDLHPRFSYDGTHIVFERRVDGFRQLFRLSIATDTEVQVTGGTDNHFSPVYSSTFERRITYLSDRNETRDLWASEEDGSIPREWLPGFGRSPAEPDYHPFLETQIVFSAAGGISRDIFKAVGIAGDLDTYWVNLTDELASDESSPTYSPEADLIFFVSSSGGTKSLWLMDFEGEFPRQLTVGEMDIDHPVVSPNFGDRRILAEVHREDGSIGLAFFDSIGGELLGYLIGGDDQ